ncbi:MAG: YncE family protein [Hyphomicrobium sp.]
MSRPNRGLAAAVTGLALLFSIPAVNAEILAIGIDRKFAYDDQAKRQALAPGRDEVLFYDLKVPTSPLLIGSLALENSIVGPPTNIAITPDERFALVANALRSVRSDDGQSWKAAPADDVHVVDLAQRPPKLIKTIKVGLQPSGIAINRDGTLALVANRAGNSISVIEIKGGDVVVKDTIAMTESVVSVAFTPDGRRALAAKFNGHKIAILDVDGAGRVTYTGRDLPVGLYPWTVTIAPDGTTALVTNIGAGAASDGNAKTVSVIDLTGNPIRVSQHISVGDAPEGVTVSPDGKMAAITVLQGSYDAPKGAWYRNERGLVSLIALSRKQAKVMTSREVGAFPEGIAFSANGRVLYVGNFASETLSILSLGNDGAITGVKEVKLPGPAASLRIGSR